MTLTAMTIQIMVKMTRSKQDSRPSEEALKDAKKEAKRIKQRARDLAIWQKRKAK